MERWRAENSHSISGKQENRVRIFWAASREAAIERFRSMQEADQSIHESGLFRVKDNSLVDEYIGYI